MREESSTNETTRQEEVLCFIPLTRSARLDISKGNDLCNISAEDSTKKDAFSIRY